MKRMVNAFSEYARAPDMKLARVDLNQLVVEVVDLYRAQEPRSRCRRDSIRAAAAARPTAAGCARC